VASLTTPSPKVQDDDDGLWRHIFCEDLGGSYTFVIGVDADDVPGYPLIAYNADSGKLEKAYTRKESGIPVLYWLPIN